MSRRGTRLALVVVACIALAGVLVSAAAALRFSDESYLTPVGLVGVPYSHRFTGPPPEQEGRGCDPPYIFRIDSGSLPPGLSLSSDGLISGTPTQAGTWSFWVSMHDDPTDKPWCNPASAEREFTITVNPRLVIGPESVPPGTVGVPYAAAMTASPPGPTTWSIAQGALPPGLTLGPTSGVISGTPTTPGSFAFTVSGVIDASRSDTKALTIVVRDPLAVAVPGSFATTGHVARSEVGVLFSSAFAATGGSGTTAWAVSGGRLPPGLVLSAAGVLAGRPTGAGSYRFAVTASDSEGRHATYDALVAVAPRLTISSARLRPARVGHRYLAAIGVSGGVRPMTCTLASGRLPSGLRLDARTGVVRGVPRAIGASRVTVRCKDILGARAHRRFTLVVAP